MRKFACVYADPAWSRKAGITDRSYENHYPTMTWDQILAMPIKNLLLPDAWVFLWMPRAHLLALHKVRREVVLDDGEVREAEIELPLAWAIASAWGCGAYSTCFIWTKTDEGNPDDQGLGLIVRDQDEVLCLFKRGRGLPKPSSTEKFGSNHRERSKPLGHSRKPEHYRRMISTMVGADRHGHPVPVLELFARVDAEHPLPPRWEAWGNQAAVSEIDESSSPETADGEVSAFAGATINPASDAGKIAPVTSPALADNYPELPAFLRRSA